MQHSQPAKPERLTGFNRIMRTSRGALAAAWVLALAGCGPDPVTDTRAPEKPFNGTRLTMSCPDPQWAAVLGAMAESWAHRTGAAVRVVTTPMAKGDDTDIGVIPAAELGGWADPGDLLPVPVVLRADDNPFQWSSVLAAYRSERWAGWGGAIQAIPLSGDGYLIVYRADRLADKAAAEAFAAKFNRPPSTPATWGEFADLAEFFAERDKKPSLPGLPDDLARADLFFRVAASHDQQGMNDVILAKTRDANPGFDPLSFQYRVDTGQPRLETHGFEQAAKWLARLKGCRPAAGSADPAAALADGSAVLAVLSLAELARLPRENGAVPARFGLAPLPGAASFLDPLTGKPVEAQGGPNYVPYFAGGKLGVVRARCANPAAAFDLLTELGGPARSLELVATPGLGVGPFRNAHLDRDRLIVWLGYGFDPERSKALQDAMRLFVRPGIGNPAFGLRGPNHAAITAAVGAEVKAIASGGVPPAEGLKRMTADWNRLDAALPAAELLQWRRRAAGLE